MQIFVSSMMIKSNCKLLLNSCFCTTQILERNLYSKLSAIQAKRQLWDVHIKQLSNLNKRRQCFYQKATFTSSTILTSKILLPTEVELNKNEPVFPPTLDQNKFSTNDSYFVPDHIKRPLYAYQKDGKPPITSTHPIGERKSHVDQERMRKAGRLAANALQLAFDLTEAGITPLEIEKQVHSYLIDKNAYASSLNYFGFPRSMLISVNEVCCHGIPNNRPFKNGDVVKYDCMAYYDGVHGDCAGTTTVGPVSARRQQLINSCRKARDQAIACCKPGLPLRLIGNYITNIAKKNGFSIVDVLHGHFIGRHLHMLPLVPHVPNQETYILQEGNAFTIEPIFVEGSPKLINWKDGWSVATADNGFSAHWEHTLLITSSGVEILTPLRDEI